MDIGTGVDIGRGSRRRRGAVATTAVALVLIGAFIAIAVSSRGPTTPAGAAEGAGAPAAPTRLETAVSWLDGLAAGVILPSDITSRLDPHDPRMAKAVRAAWNDLGTSVGEARFHQALSWIDGLAAGRIIRSDMASRLGARDPKLAEIVMATWADLVPIPDRSV